MSQLSLRVFLLLVVFLWQCLAFSFGQPSSIVDAVINSVTGCTDVYPITVNCSMPANLTFHTSGVGQLLVGGAAGQSVVLVDYPGGRISFPVYLDATDSTNSTLWATVRPGAYSPQWLSTLLNVSLLVSGYANIPSPAFTFAYEPVPVISSISGCTGSGQATLNCLPDSAVLTIQGTGIGWLATTSMQLRIGDNTVYTQPYSSFTDVNATYGTLSLASIYYGLLLPEHYNGVMLPLQFQSTTTLAGGSRLVIATNVMSISFAPLPPPVFNTPYSTLCLAVSSGQLANYTGCMPGASGISITGHYLYGLSATVGSAPCVVYSSDADSFNCNPAVAAGLLPNTAYPVRFSNALGSLTLPSYMSFTVQPSIAYIAPCTPTPLATSTPSLYRINSPSCQPGASLTIRGSQFPTGNQTVAVNILSSSSSSSSSTQAFNLSCLTPTVIDSTSVACVLPAASAIANATTSSLYGRTVYVRLAFGASSVWTNGVGTQLFRNPQAPNIVSLVAAGCDSTTTSSFFPGSPLQASNCASNATLTLTGSNFNGSRLTVSGSAYTATQQTSTTTTTVLSSTLTQVVVQLPDINNPPSTPIVSGTPYQFAVATNAPSYLLSGVFLVTFAAAPPSSPASSAAASSSGLSTGAIAGLVVAGVLGAVIVCAVLAVMSVRLLRRARVKRSTAGGGGGGGDGGEQDVGWFRPKRLHEDSSSSDAISGVELQ